jgi:predicted SAM-dependent methyltransferase
MVVGAILSESTMMRNLIRRIPGARQAYHMLKSSHSARETAAMVEGYLRQAGEKKLHLGCGGNILQGWLNSDYFPVRPDILHLDATKTFPLPADSFDYIFSEHMIEHISYNDGLVMLRESFRVLKAGGKIRLSTPNIKFLIDLYAEPKSPLQSDYIAWATEKFIKTTEKSDTLVINNFVRDWGHKFIYDPKTLTSSLEMAGFTQVESFEINRSNDTALMDLENTARMPPGFLQLESFTLEARKPQCTD